MKSPRPPSSWLRTPRRSSPAPNSSPTAATPGPDRRPWCTSGPLERWGALPAARVRRTRPVRPKQPDRGNANLHRMLIHLVEETGRHSGHTDIVRELLDGAKEHY
ncbi:MULTISPECIES: DUF664 domain-containing protein [Streptomyces]|uniref:mycothiol transferase n=1 Tax=Streptomyces TaxID=1883 RepID=UPI00225A8760|nr:DUF664 domain-containing protein [Streptomyces sp. NBC_01373]MCX4698876.1 DinB family protein [Streptomyces sp. NBC_01373]